MSRDHNPGGNAGVGLGVELTPDAPVNTLVELGAATEEAGIDTIFVSNHYNNRDPYVTLSAIAEETEQVRLGPGVVNPYESHPARIATQIATLDELSDGRAVCGIGAGDSTTLGTLGIERFSPVETVREAVDVTRRLWAGERVDHTGTFEANAAALSYESRSIPVYVGAQGPVMLRMSAAHADGILVNAAHPADYRWASRQIEDGCNERPADTSGLTVAGFASISIDTNLDRARDTARPPVAFITAGTPEEVIERHDLDAGRVTDIQEALSAGDRRRAYELVTPAMIDTFCVAGTPETVRDRLQSILEYVDGIVAASPLGPDREAAIGLLGEVGDRLRDDRVLAG